MGRPKKEDVLELAKGEIPGLIKAVGENPLLNDRHKQIILTLIKQVTNIQQTAKEKEAALNRIKRMLGQTTEKDKDKPQEKEKPKSPAKNHGRNGVDDYHFSRIVDYPHVLKPGDECPECGHGTLQSMEPRKIIRLVGQPSIIAELHRPARLRCSGCGGMINVSLPEEVGEEKADASANTVVAVFRYGMGLPMYRLAAMQEAMGVPLPASTQYEMVEALWTQVVPVYKELLNQAANGSLHFIDDTRARILSLFSRKEERKQAGERVGMFTTGIVAQKDDHKICLFFTGWKHAGENFTDLLNRRIQGLDQPMQVSDALSRNFPKDNFTIVILCLIHARRNFVDCQEAYPDDSAYVIERIGRVYANESHIVNQGMDAQKRLEYHQQMSASAMEEIRNYARQKLETRDFEPNSVLGGSFAYLLKHWEGLTQFLRIPGAPLDNNEVERLLKKSVLHRKNSLFYKTEDGARVGDVMMSLIQTTIEAGENPFDYFTVLQRHSRHVAKNPHLWFPWNYKNILKSIEPPKPG